MFAVAPLLLSSAAALLGLHGSPDNKPTLAASNAAAPAVVRLPLPSPGRRLLLPPVAGPADTRRPLVVIDPGHGGVDRGAVGGERGDEKTLALALARALRDELVGRGRVRVALTRDSDRLLTLEERANIAARLAADLFVSVHLGSAAPAGGAGLSVYTRAARASDALAERVAQAENGSVLVRSPAVAERPAGLLSPRQASERSTVFANLVIRESRGRLRLNRDPRGEAPFAVLAGIAAPAVLVEAGSVHDPANAQALASPAGRAGFARAVAQAIDTFFARLPPER